MEREEIEEALITYHNDTDEELYGSSRIIHGYYYRESIQVTFYYKPSFYSRMKMYWIFGWSWRDVKKQDTKENNV